MSQLLTQKRSPEAKSRPTALVGLLVMMAAIAVPIGFAGAQGPQLIFSDDFESSGFNSAWTEVTNYEVVLDPTGERPDYVASVKDLLQGTPPTLMVKDDLSLGPGTIARVFFYDDGWQDGDDHTAALDGVLGSIGIVARYSSESGPSSKDFYIFDPGGTTETTSIPRNVGWHEFRFTITSTGASAFIDGAFVGTVEEITAAEIFGIESNGGVMALWDDVAIGPIVPAMLEVNTNDDEDDGTCDDLHCSLREAINAANAIPGLDEIAFNIPRNSPHTIQPSPVLPTITDPVTIDGTTQPGFSGTPVIELDGTLVQGLSDDGLHITAGNSTVRGLVINQFGRSGIYIDNGDGNVIEGNFIGTDVKGKKDLGNSFAGVAIGNGSTDNLIGGTNPGAGNVISGNDHFGVGIGGSGAEQNVVQGNLIGTDVTGTKPLGNTLVGIYVMHLAADNIIGGSIPGARNIISANGYGVVIGGDEREVTGTVVAGNFIGTDITGTADLGNSGNGVTVQADSTGNLIGGSEPGAGNVISGNDGSGVAIAISENWTAQNAIFGNAIYSNAGLGIDLGDDGVTSNDALDADSGPNQRQNFPILTSAISGATSTTIEGTLNSKANTSFTLEFFSSSACDPSGYGEGEDFLGSNDVMTDGSGDTGFLVTLGTALPAGQFITATATDPDYNTSEFSACVELLTPEEAALHSSIDDLQSIVNSNPDTDLAKEVEAAIKNLDKALDELSETPPNNIGAVGEIEKAVKQLDKAIDEGLDPVRGAELMDQLSLIARQLAADALARAIAQEGDPARIADAEQALFDGDALRGSEAFEDAVNKYREALKKAESALP